MRSKSASELWTSTATFNRLPIGKKSRVWSVVKAISVPVEIAAPYVRHREAAEQ